jgi:3-oxoacyl-[acyl-carrier-protein] synthase III
MVWFGVLLCVNMQTSFMHPPFGFALFYLRGIADTLFKEGRIEKPVKSNDIYMGAIPWVIMQLVLVVIVIFVPETVTMFLDKEEKVDLDKVVIEMPTEQEVPEADRDNPIRLGCLRMNGREVFKFAVNRFRQVIEEALEATRLTPDDLSQVICHQSNIRIIESAMEKIGLPKDKVFVNIDRFGNSSAGSVGLCLDQVWRAGKVPAGKPMMMVAFGGGMTWASGVWNV